MTITTHYRSPLGDLLLSGDEAGLTGLWFEDAKYYPQNLEGREGDLNVWAEAKLWLDVYFSGHEPEFTPPLHLSGTPFQLEVWQILQEIPYGQTTTYGAIAQKIAAARGLSHMSAQAVGGAVGHNPVSILVPCHRVVGHDGSLTGYAGGIDRKRRLLALEGIKADAC